MKVRGNGVYLYRAVDGNGRPVHLRLSGQRDVGAARLFATRRSRIRDRLHGPPHWTVTRHRHRAVREMKSVGQLPVDTQVPSSKYPNNLVEQTSAARNFTLVQWSAPNGAGPQRSRSLASSCSAATAKASSTSAGHASKTEVRPLSGTRCWQRNKTTRFEPHRNHIVDFTTTTPEPFQIAPEAGFPLVSGIPAWRRPSRIRPLSRR